MRSFSVALAVLALAACEPNSSHDKAEPSSEVQPAVAKEVPAPVKGPALDTPIKRDLDRICNAEEQSGALHEIPSARAQHVAVWLATSLESQDARTLSAELVALAPPERIARMKSVLAENGMSDCEILATW